MADMIAINKSEGENRPKSELAAGQYRNALHLFPMPDSGWAPKVTLCSAYTKEGIPEIWNEVLDYVSFTKQNEFFQKKRHEQNIRILYETIDSLLKDNFYRLPEMKERLAKVEQDILQDKISGYVAAQNLINYYFESIQAKEV